MADTPVTARLTEEELRDFVKACASTVDLETLYKVAEIMERRCR